MVKVWEPARGGPGRAFVGRDRELADLVAGLDDAIAGRVRLVLIAGEPGIGKTWLAEHLAEHAAKQGARVLWVHCWEGGGAPPFWPWAQLLRVLAEGLDDRTLAAWLGAGAAQVAQLLPGLAERLRAAALPPGPARASEAARFVLFEAVTRFLRQAAATQPLMMVMEDLQAADTASLLLLEFLARDLRGGRLLVMGTCRNLTVERGHGFGDTMGQLVREGHLLTLRGLDRGEVAELIEAISGTPPSEAMAAAVHEATEGNPLFVRETVRLLATDVTLQDPGRLRVPLSGSVRTVIGRRLAPLSADAVLVLSAAAVVGREFDLPLVRAACELPIERILTGLSEAVALDVVTEAEGAVGRYRFCHSLIREVLYERLPIPARTDLHRRVGLAIERQDGDALAPRVAELAHHFARAAAAGDAAKALAYAREAGERAMAMHAYEEAAAQYRRALEALRFTDADEAVRCELLLRLGAAQARAGRCREAETSCLEAAELSRRLGSSEQLAHAALALGAQELRGGAVNRPLIALLREALEKLPVTDSPLRARLLARLSQELALSHEPELAKPTSREAVQLARRLGEAATLGAALCARWMAVWGPEGLEERSALAEELMRLARATSDQELELAARSRRATSSLQSGDIRGVEADVVACARLAEADTLAEQARSLQPDGPNVSFAYHDLIEALRRDQGRLQELRPVWQEQMAKFPWFLWPRLWLSLTDVDLGDEVTARRSLQSVVTELLRRPRDGLWLPPVAVAALVAARLHEPAAPDRLYRALLPYRTQIIVAAMPHPVVCFGSASFYLGLLATATARWAEAGDQFEAAIAVHERLGAGPLLARTRLAYARMLLARDRPADRRRAGQLLEQALAAADVLGMAAVTGEALALQAAQAAQAAGTSRGAAAAAAAEVAGNVFRREGEYWTIGYEGSVVRLKDSKGLRHLARLLAQPGRELLAADLEAADNPGAGPPPSGSPQANCGELRVRPDLGDAGELLDAMAKAAYRARVEELRVEVEEAEGLHDPVRPPRPGRSWTSWSPSWPG